MAKYMYLLNSDVRNFVEYQIRYFPENKRQLESMKTDRIPSAIPKYGPQAGGSFNSEARPSEETAIRIMSDRYIMQLEYTVKSIDSVLNKLNDLDMELIRLKYWNGSLTPEGIAMKLHMSRATVYNRLNNILVEIARRLGYIDI
jgi:RinA family phage transcriptional activator